MAIPFQRVYPDEIKIPASRVHSLTETYRGRQRTGLIRLAYSAERLLYLLFQRGTLLNAYLMEKVNSHKVENWEEIVNSSSEAFARLVPLSPPAIEMCKLALESQAHKTETLSAPDLRVVLDGDLVQTTDPKLFQFVWNAAEGLLFLQGGKLESRSLFFAPDRLVDEMGVSPSFSLWSEPEVQATYYMINSDVPAWQEYILRRTFGEICNRATVRYEEITGRAIVDSMIRSIALYTSRNSMEINITERQVADRELFSTPQAAADTYRALLRIIIDQIRQVIGDKLSNSILSGIMAGLRFDEFEIARSFSILPPELFRADRPRQSADA